MIREKYPACVMSGKYGKKRVSSGSMKLEKLGSENSLGSNETLSQVILLQWLRKRE